MEGMKAYSQDLRERVLRAVDQGMPRRELVRILGVGAATIGRYLKQQREQGHVRPKAIPGRPSKKIQPVQAGLEDQLKAYPDATLAQHCEYWEQNQGMRVSRWRMSRALKRMGWTRKKRHWEPPSATKKLAPHGESR